MILRRQSDEAALPSSRGRRVCIVLMTFGMAALQMLSVSLAVDRSNGSSSDDDSSNFVVFPTRSARKPWFVEQTAGHVSPDVVKLEQDGAFIRRGQNVNVVGPQSSSAKLPPLYEPIPVFASDCEMTTPGCGTCQPFPIADPHRLRFCDDVRTMPNRVSDDIGALASWDNLIFLGAAAGGTVILHDNVDNRVRDDTLLHGPRWGQFSAVFSHGSESLYVHAPLLATMYVVSLCQQNEDLHELTLAMFTSFKFAVLGSVALQYATHTHHTQGGLFNLFRDSGFPSEGTAASFALAAVIDERFGWQGGVPAYLVSGLIGWSEIDQNHHTVSEVFFGAALGYVIGKSIGAMHYHPHAPFKLVPFVDSYTGTQGIGFEVIY